MAADGASSAPRLDLTMPSRRQFAGAKHPVTLVIEEIVAIFRELGFTVATGARSGNRVVQLHCAELPAGSSGHGRARYHVSR